MQQVILQKTIEIYQKKRGLNAALLGELGSGKTFFVKEFIKMICPALAKEVASPTFSYFHIYQHKKICIHHFDLYRIQNEDKLYDIGIWESLEDMDSLTLIEWADLFPSILQICDLGIHFSFIGNKFLVSLK